MLRNVPSVPTGYINHMLICLLVVVYLAVKASTQAATQPKRACLASVESIKTMTRHQNMSVRVVLKEQLLIRRTVVVVVPSHLVVKHVAQEHLPNKALQIVMSGAASIALSIGTNKRRRRRRVCLAT